MLVLLSLQQQMMLGREAILQVLISMVCVEVVLQKSRLTFLGYDSYPNGFDCANPYVWLPDAVPE